MKYLAVLAVIGLLTNAAASVPAHAQTTPAPKNNPTEKPVTGATTPERVISELEALAVKRQNEGGAPFARAQGWRIGLPDSVAEFAAMRKYAALLYTAFSQKSEELPLKRIFIKAGGQELMLHKLSSWRSNVDSKLVIYKMYGRYREDGFYLVPIGPLTRDGIMIAEFAVPGAALNVDKLPSPAVVRRGAMFANPDAPPDAKPDAKTLKALIERKFTGFPVPKYP